MRFWVWIVIVVVLIVLAISIFSWKGVVSQEAAIPSIVVANVPPSVLPSKFPPNVPCEQTALIVSNFNATAQNGQLQATRSFKSSKTVAENISLYAGFLANKANGWTAIASSAGSSGGKIMVATNGEGLLTIRVSPISSQPTSASLVEIDYVTNPPTTASSSAR